MQEQLFYPTPRQDKAARVRASFHAAAGVLSQGHSLLTMLLGSLFCLMSAFAAYLFWGMLGYVLSGIAGLSPWAVGICGLVFVGVLLLFLLLPLFLGRVRLGGLLASGEEPLVKEMFYYFTSGTRYLRALWVGTVYFLCFALPLMLCAGAFVLSFWLYENVFLLEATQGVALLLLLLCDLLCVALCVLCLYFSALYFNVVALLVGNEGMSLGGALCLAFVKGWRHRGSIYRFLLVTLWHILLGVLTLGVLWLLYYAHHTTISYFHLCISLFTEE